MASSQLDRAEMADLLLYNVEQLSSRSFQQAKAKSFMHISVAWTGTITRPFLAFWLTVAS